MSEGLLHLRTGLTMAGRPELDVGESVCAALRDQVRKLGLSIGDEPVWGEAAFEEIVDPFSQEVSLVGYWRGKARYGKATFFPDGRVFAEYQVLLAHPGKPDSYVESVQIWGRPQHWRGEATVASYLK